MVDGSRVLVAGFVSSACWVGARGRPTGFGSGGIHSERRGGKVVIGVVMVEGSASLVVVEVGVEVGHEVEVVCG